MAVTGRPTKLTDETIAEIAAKVRNGIHPESAARACGISTSLFYELKSKAKQGLEPFATFWNEVARAEAQAEVGFVETVRLGDEAGLGFGPAKASLELLQRRFPKRWSQQVKVEVSDQLTRFLDAAERICKPEDFRKLLEELADETGEGTTREDPGSRIDAVH
jgi:hypothetical protein